MQPDQSSQPGFTYTPESKPAKSVNVLGIVMSLFTILFLCVSAGLGYWAYTLNTDLTATKQSLDTLQGQYDGLQADNAALNSNIEQLTADLNQTKADLEKTQADLATTQGDLAKEQENSASLRERMDKTLQLVDVAIALWVNDETLKGVEKKVIATGDEHLKDLWDAFIANSTSKTFNAFEDYLYEAMADLLK